MGWIADLLKEIPSAARYKAELEEMEGENAKLKQKVISLESENENLRQEIQRRNNIIQKEKSHDNLLSDIEIKLLLFVANNGSKNSIQIAEEMGIADTIIDFHLLEMKEKGVVIAHRVPMLGDCWCVEQKGRKYLIENKLIS